MISIQNFDDDGAEDIFRGINSKKARKSCPRELHQNAREKLEMLDSANNVNDVKRIPGNRYEKLKGTNKESVRFNNQYRILFCWAESGPTDVEISKHYE